MISSISFSGTASEASLVQDEAFVSSLKVRIGKTRT